MLQFGKNVVHLKEVPTDSNDYLVLFHDNECFNCQKIAPEWSLAADYADGLAIIAAIDCSKYKCDPEKNIPSIYHISDKTETKYPGRHNAREYLKWASALINDTAEIVTVDNFKPTSQYTILFNSSPIIPKIWAVVEKKLKNQNVTFMCSQDLKLLKKLNQTRIPGIYVVKNNDVELYEGKMSTSEILKFMEEFFSSNKDL